MGNTEKGYSQLTWTQENLGIKPDRIPKKFRDGNFFYHMTTLSDELSSVSPSPKQQSTAFMLYVFGASYKEIGKCMGISPNTAKEYVAKAKKRLGIEHESNFSIMSFLVGSQFIKTTLPEPFGEVSRLMIAEFDRRNDQ